MFVPLRYNKFYRFTTGVWQKNIEKEYIRKKGRQYSISALWQPFILFSNRNIPSGNCSSISWPASGASGTSFSKKSGTAFFWKTVPLLLFIYFM